jgi:hypothetical protein
MFASVRAGMRAGLHRVLLGGNLKASKPSACSTLRPVIRKYLA